jgi:hypothetical protein
MCSWLLILLISSCFDSLSQFDFKVGPSVASGRNFAKCVELLYESDLSMKDYVSSKLQQFLRVSICFH